MAFIKMASYTTRCREHQRSLKIVLKISREYYGLHNTSSESTIGRIIGEFQEFV